MKLIIFILFLGCSLKAQTKMESGKIDSLLFWIENEYFVYNNGWLTAQHDEIDISRMLYSNLKPSVTNKSNELAMYHRLNYEMREVFNLDSVNISFCVPTDSIFYSSNCENNKSFLVYTNGLKTELLEINMNPYCSEQYDIESVDIFLFRTKLIKNPIVAIMSNSPACVPIDIYVYSKEDDKYVFIKELCIS